MALDVGINIKAHNADALRGIVATDVALAKLDRRSSTSRSMSKLMHKDLQIEASDRKLISRELYTQSKAVKSLSLDYVALRRTLLTFSVRTAIIGLSAVASAANAAAAGVGTLSLSLANFAGAAGIGAGASILALIQGYGVLRLAMKGVGKALTTTGKLHELAMSKLTKPARAFVHELETMRGTFREMKLLAQQGLFPGLVRGLQNAQKILPVFRQSVWDTAQAMGYLGERAGEMIGRRGPELNRFFQRNIITLRRMGTATENFAAGFLDVFIAAEPLIGHVTRAVVHFSETVKTKFAEWRKDGSFSDFFTHLKKSWDNWTGAIGHAAKSIFNVWTAAEGPIHKVENAIESTMKKAEKWTGGNKKSITKYFDDSLVPLGSFVKLVGALGKSIGQLGIKGNTNLTRIFDGLRTKFLPLLDKMFTQFNDKLFPNLITLGGEVVDFVDAALPGIQSMLGFIAPIATALKDMLSYATKLVDWANKLGSGAGVFATFAIGAAVIASWRMLKTEVGLVMLAMRKAGGFAPGISNKAIGKSMVQAAWPVQLARNTAIFGRSAYSRTGSFINEQAERRANRTTIIGGGRGGPVRTTSQGGLYEPDRLPFDRGGNPYMPMDPYSRRNQHVLPYPTGPYRQPRIGRINFGQFAPYGLERRRFTAGDPMFGGGRGHIPGAVTVVTGGDTMNPRPLRRGVQMRGAPIHSSQRPPSMGYLGSAKPGGEGARMFKAYEKQMTESTRKGFWKGLRGGMGGSMGIMTGFAGTAALTAGLALAPSIAGHFQKNLSGKNEMGLMKNPKLPDFFSSFFGEIGTSSKLPDAEKQIRNFGDNVEGLYKKAKKAGDSRALLTLAHQANDLGKLGGKGASELRAWSAAVKNELLASAAPDFEQFFQRADTSVSGIRDGLAVLQNDLGNRLPASSREYKEAMATSFGAAASKVKAAMDAQLISQGRGMREMRKLLIKQFETLGFTASQARHLAAGGGQATGRGGGNESGSVSNAPVNNIPTNPTQGHGGNANARGGFHIGRAGASARDNVPMMVNGKRVMAAEGEYVGIFNRHQKPQLDSAVGALGYSSLEQFMDGNNKPHYMAGGGIIPLGHQLQHQGYVVSEHPAFGGVHGGHAANGWHPRGGAIDVNADNWPNGEKPALDALAARLIRQGWHVLWQVADHFDHLHVDIGSGVGGGVDFKMPRVKAKGVGGTPLVQAMLDRARGGFKAVGENALAGLGATGGDTGGGNQSNMQIARAMLGTFGWGDNQWSPLRALGMGESGWSETALNESSGAFGIGQFLGKTKEAYAKFGATSKVPARQINAMLQYIKDRYRSPAAAYQSWLSRDPHWYTGGGIIEAWAGLLDAHSSASPPPRGETPPTINPDDAIAPHSKKKKKKKDKKPPHIEPRPALGQGVGAKRFAPRGKKPKRPKLRPRVRKLITGPWNNPELSKTDPITGEKSNLLTQFYEAWGKQGEKFSTNLSILQGEQSLTDEQAIVTDDNENEVLNQSGMTVGGKFIPGIDQALAEITEQKKIYKTLGFKDRRSEDGGILGVFETQQGYARGLIPFLKAGVAERRARILKLKKIFEANVELRKAQYKKLKKMRGQGLNWRQGIELNKNIIEKWRHWKRDSDESPAARREADSEIDRLTTENQWLDKHHPKPLSTGTPQYEKMLASWNQRGYENKRIVGDVDQHQWGTFTDDSAAGRMIDSLSFFTETRDFFVGEMEPLRTSIAQTKNDIGQLDKSYEDWSGTKAPILKPDQSSQDELLKGIGEAVLKHGWESANKTSILAGMQPLVDARAVGAFAHGGLVPETGYALVHKGEWISPDPAGPYRNGMNATTTSDNRPINVELVFRDKAGSMVELIDARVDKRAAQVTSRQQGMQARLYHASPGG